MYKTIALILAGGTKPQMEILSIKRTKAAIPFAGCYRIIDFPLSNLMNSGIEKVGILAQHRPDSLMDHIGGGSAWDYAGRERTLQILPPHIDMSGSRWYQGTADAINQNQNFFSEFDPLDELLVVAGDHVYFMDYYDVIEYHRAKNADMTLVVKHEEQAAGKTYGHVVFGTDGRIHEYAEKPEKPLGSYISLCIYVFKIGFLRQALAAYNDDISTHDIGREIILRFLDRSNFFAYEFTGPWYYLGDIKTYCDANMELLHAESLISLKDWRVCTNLDDRNMGIRPPAKIMRNAHVVHSMISDGCIVEGQVINSILSPGVKIGPDAVVRDSILMHDCIVNSGSFIEKAVLDKDVWIGKNTRVGIGENTLNKLYPDFFFSGISVIGRSVKIQSESIIGKNCVIYPGDGVLELKTRILESGKTIRNGVAG